MIIYITQQNKRTMKNFERTCGCLANDFSLGSPLMTVGYNISPVCSFIISFLTRLPTMSVFSDSSSISLYIAGTGKTEFSRACEVVENDTHLSPPRIYRFTNGFLELLSLNLGFHLVWRLAGLTQNVSRSRSGEVRK